MEEPWRWKKKHILNVGQTRITKESGTKHPYILNELFIISNTMYKLNML